MKGTFFLADATTVAQEVVDTLTPYISKIAICGSIRRTNPVVGDIDIIVTGLKSGFHNSLLNLGCAPVSIKNTFTREGIQIDVSTVEECTWGAALLHFTGSKWENIRLRKVAKDQGLTLSQYGLRKVGTNELVAGRLEEEVYQALGVTYKEPGERD